MSDATIARAIVEASREAADQISRAPALREAEKDVNCIIRGQAKQRREQSEVAIERLFLRR